MPKLKDLTGTIFGRLTVLKFSHKDDKNKLYWECKCNCGNPNLKIVNGAYLRAGNTKSCGCLAREMVVNMNKTMKKKSHALDVSGQKFGRLTAIENSPSDNPKYIKYWKCLCDCGDPNYIIVAVGNLRSGNTKSCGCLVRELEQLTSNTLQLKDMTGLTFGRLHVIGRAESDNNGARWFCMCSCGNQSPVNIRGSDLRSGTTQSCGCLRNERSREVVKKYNAYNLFTEDYGIGWATNTNKEFFFDLEDYNKIKEYCWHEDPNGYIIAWDIYSEKEQVTRLHTVIMDTKYTDEIVDHIYHNKWDNRKSELRICTYSENGMNRIIPSNNTSGVKGVCWNKKANNWHSYIGINHKRINLGYFNNFEDAVKARKDAEIKYHGEFVCRI